MNKTINIQTLFAPKATDVQYTQRDQLMISLICRVDSYKFSHPFAYPDDIKISGMTSYGETRVSERETIIPFGMQLFLKRYLTQTVTMQDIDNAEAFTVAHFGRKLFDRKSWEKVVNVYKGKLPLIIRSVPEGMPIKGSMPLYTVTVIDDDLFWMSAGFETMIQRGVWYPTTIATYDHESKGEMRTCYEATGSDLNILPFALHDFGGRGVTCGEQAEIGGAAHLVHFMGSDTVEGILTANFYYKEAMAGHSVYATEHAIECSFGGGRADAIRYIRRQLKNAPEGSIISIVIDGYDVYREAELLCTVFKDEIIASKAKVVFRPDSGDMMIVVPKLLEMQAKAFGFKLNAKGYREINYVGVIQGDGVDRLAIISLLGKIAVHGYAASSVMFGSGGALLQKVNRDSLKFAQKACAILVDGNWIGIAKKPITDPGKNSKEGVVTTARDKVTGELFNVRLDQGELPENLEDIMQLTYYLGDLYNETTLAEVRARAA